MEEVPRLDILGWTVRMRCSTEKPDTEGPTAHGSIYMQSPEQANAQRQKRRAARGWKRLGETAHGRKCRGLGGSDGYPIP